MFTLFGLLYFLLHIGPTRACKPSAGTCWHCV